jgi:hypothetical protein
LPGTFLRILKMNEKQALRIARKYLADRMRLTVNKGVPTDLIPYAFNLQDEIFVSYDATMGWSIGESDYLSVNRVSGRITLHGRHGE